jgi:hypothetical protein
LRYRILLEVEVESEGLTGTQLTQAGVELHRDLDAFFKGELKAVKKTYKVFQIEELDYPEVDIEKICK